LTVAHFILDYFDTDPSADHVSPVFGAADAPNIMRTEA